jgi:hypothetical protein
MEHYSTIRFMGWQNTNNNNEIEWADRPTAQNATLYSGVPFEYIISLSNILGSNPWFCIPHQASNDYISKLFSLIKSSLRYDLKV